jgi:hypothetical protein
LGQYVFWFLIDHYTESLDNIRVYLAPYYGGSVENVARTKANPTAAQFYLCGAAQTAARVLCSSNWIFAGSKMLCLKLYF